MCRQILTRLDALTMQMIISTGATVLDLGAVMLVKNQIMAKLLVTALGMPLRSRSVPGVSCMLPRAQAASAVKKLPAAVGLLIGSSAVAITVQRTLGTLICETTS